MIKAYLTTDPGWTAKFSDVWSWTEWPGRAGVTDIGIDLVAANRDRDDFTAIPCKFDAADAHVEKRAIDSFLSLSMRLTSFRPEWAPLRPVVSSSMRLVSAFPP